METLVVVGLRNFGYNGTRHNIAEAVLLELAKTRNISFSRNKDGSEICDHSPNVILALPKTFMNLSGKPVKHLLSKPYNPSNLLVVHDELDLALGKAKVRALGGSARGHNGLKSIIASLGGLEKFPRVLVGIDRPNSKDPEVISRHVLGKFTSKDSVLLDAGIDLAVSVVEQEIAKWQAQHK
ncbi:peptidyl-tRNA hydrolase [Batrachochytrium salamandrivorans]|nr:peptidyl-tRNA hydrolase [Batrachochytrium salamandrivorans]